MSEPRSVADSVEEMQPGLYHYHVFDDRIDTGSDAYALVDAGRMVLVDPLPLDEAVADRLGTPEAIVIAVSSHQRSAWRVRKRSGARVHAPRDAPDLEAPADAWFGDGDRLPGGLRAVHAPGPAATHHVLYLASGSGVLFLADLVMRGGDGGGELRFLSDEHLSDPAAARRSARLLLEYRFDTLCFGHGRPLLRGGRQALVDLLQRDGGADG